MPFTQFNLIEDFEVGKPITSEMVRALAENPLAVADGDDTGDIAPRVQSRKSGNCAIASEDGIVGDFLQVSSIDSPDGKGKLVVPVSPMTRPAFIIQQGMEISLSGSDRVLGYSASGTIVASKDITWNTGASHPNDYFWQLPVQAELYVYHISVCTTLPVYSGNESRIGYLRFWNGTGWATWGGAEIRSGRSPGGLFQLSFLYRPVDEDSHKIQWWTVHGGAASVSQVGDVYIHRIGA